MIRILRAIELPMRRRAYASHRVATGIDLSELALGWATYNGDHMSMYGINASIPKTLVLYLHGIGICAVGSTEAGHGYACYAFTVKAETVKCHDSHQQIST